MSDLIKKTILVVDDEDHVHESVNEMLLGSCDNILHASDGVEASKITDTEKVDLIISDINMPEMDGLKLLGKIRWNHPDITVIIMSGAQKNIENKGNIISQGYHFLKKPFEKNQLLGAICSTLSVTTGDVENEDTVIPGTVQKKRENPNKGLSDKEIKWHKFYNLLSEYHDENPFKWPRTKDVYKRQKLGAWVNKQRKEYESYVEDSPSQLSQDQINMLNNINFIWCSHESQWLEKFEELVDFRQKKPDKWPACVGLERTLGVWCSSQRAKYRKSVEDKEEIEADSRYTLLKKIGFQFTVDEE